MDKIKTVKIKNEDGSVSQEAYYISADARNIDMANGYNAQDTIGTIDVYNNGSIAEQLNNINNGINNIEIDIKKKAYYFDTIVDMKNADLKVGDMAITLGYYETNDGGGGTYQIVKDNTLTDDGGSVHDLINGNKAKLIIKESVNIKQYGAKGDGTFDNATILKKMFNSCREKNITSFFFPKGIYNISDTVLDYGIDGLVIRGENDDIYNSTIIRRTADVTIFNFGGIMTLEGISYRASDLILENLTFRDLNNSYTNNVFATLHYSMHCTISNCTIACRNKALDLKHFYDSRFINTDFNAGGNETDAMITIHGGKNASPTEIGWDGANTISFIACRFERYFGCAIRTTNETQPSTINPNYNPVIGRNVNTIWFDYCRFEAPTLLSGHHLDFNYTSGIRLDIQITTLDGQPNLQPINFSRCTGVFGKIYATYNQSTVTSGITFTDFEQPLINIEDNSGRFDVDLIVGTVFNHYLLDYFVNITAGDLTRRNMKFNLIYDGKSKKLFNQTSSNQQINSYNEGRQINYGTYENGFGLKVNNTINNSFINNMTYASSNDWYTKQNRYINSANSSRILDEQICKENGDYHRFDSPIVANNPIMIIPNKFPSNIISAYRSNSSQGRVLMYASSFPSEQIENVLFKAGDIIFNSLPSAGSNIGWVCVSGGNPGTWKAFGTIES